MRAADACDGEFFIEAAGDKDLRRGLKKAGELAAAALRPCLVRHHDRELVCARRLDLLHLLQTGPIESVPGSSINNEKPAEMGRCRNRPCKRSETERRGICG